MFIRVLGSKLLQLAFSFPLQSLHMHDICTYDLQLSTTVVLCQNANTTLSTASKTIKFYSWETAF